ncbi:MAG: diguanylate cyclase [Gammaproteobacteria bacterium]
MPAKSIQALPFDAGESNFLRQLEHIRLCVNPDWMPYDFVNRRGEYSGMNADFHQFFAERIGKEIRVVKTLTWEQSLEFVKQRKCDILSSAASTRDLQPFLAFTRPFNHYPIVIAVRDDQAFIRTIDDVLARPFVAVKGFAASALVKRIYPEITIIEVDNARAALEWVSTGKAFGYLDTVATIGYQSQKYGILNIKIAGVTEASYAMSVAVRNDWPYLLSVYNKAIASMTETERLTILNKWISLKYEKKGDHDHRLIGFILSGIAAFLLLLVLREFVVNKYRARLQALNRELEQLSNTDALTGIANRRLLNHVFEKEITRAERYRSKFSVIMLDVDFFKAINDDFGHQIGDDVLKSIADLMIDTIRESDLAGRWGGEEFLILCPETELSGALQVAETIRQKIQRHDFGMPSGITASLGVAEHREGQSLHALIKAVDTALYEAKKAGRNTVKTAS